MRKRYGGRSSIRNWRTIYYMYYTTVSIYEESHRKEGAPKIREKADAEEVPDIPDPPTVYEDN